MMGEVAVLQGLPSSCSWNFYDKDLNDYFLEKYHVFDNATCCKWDFACDYIFFILGFLM